MKTLKTIVKVLLACVVGLLLAAWADEHHVGYRYGFVAVYFGGAVGVYYALECIAAMWRNRRRQTRYGSIRYRRGIDLKQAA